MQDWSLFGIVQKLWMHCSRTKVASSCTFLVQCLAFGFKRIHEFAAFSPSHKPVNTETENSWTVAMWLQPCLHSPKCMQEALFTFFSEGHQGIPCVNSGRGDLWLFFCCYDVDNKWESLLHVMKQQHLFTTLLFRLDQGLLPKQLGDGLRGIIFMTDA